MTQELFDRLLGHYARKTPQAFIQVDGHDVGVDGGDCLMEPDDDGHCLTSGIRHELMHGCAVRVLMDLDTTPDDAATLLRKIADWVDRGAIDTYATEIAAIKRQIKQAAAEDNEPF